MQRVIVNVQRAGDPRTREVEVSVGVPGARLAELIARALSWDREANGDRVIFEIEVLPLGRRLGPQESLRAVDVWDGAWLILHMVGTERWGDMSDPDEMVEVPEQVWSREPDLPTDIGVRWFSTLEPSVHISATPLHAPDELPTWPEPPVTVRGETDTQPVGVRPAAQSAPMPSISPTTLPPASPAPTPAPTPQPSASPVPDAPPTTVVERIASPSSQPGAPSPEAAAPPTDAPASAPPESPAIPPADSPLKGFRPWRSRRQPPPSTPP